MNELEAAVNIGLDAAVTVVRAAAKAIPPHFSLSKDGVMDIAAEIEGMKYGAPPPLPDPVPAAPAPDQPPSSPAAAATAEATA